MPKEFSNEHMEELRKGNSFRARKKYGQDKKGVTRVVSGKVLRKKRTLKDTIFLKLFGSDGSAVTEYVVKDVLLPAARNTLSDMVTGAVEMLLFGETRGKSRKNEIGRSLVSYGSMFNKERQRFISSQERHSRIDLDDLIIDDSGEANEVLSNLVDLIETYGEVSVADYMDLLGITGEYTDDNYGWKNLSRAFVDRVRNGYIIRLPKPIVLD